MPTSQVELPQLAGLPEAASLSSLELRPFGQHYADVEIDFRRRARPALVTEVLGCCTSNGGERPLDESFFRELPVGVRLHAMVLLWLMSGRSADVGIRCSDESCGADFEITAPLVVLLETARAHDPGRPVEVAVGESSLRLRLPTGGDLERWAACAPSRAEIIAELLEDGTVIDTAADPTELDLIEAALSAADPLVDLELDGECPDCGRPFRVPFDLEAEALRVLEGEQRAVLDSVDRIARVYHWSEAEILALPRWRRRAYLDRIGEELR